MPRRWNTHSSSFPSPSSLVAPSGRLPRGAAAQHDPTKRRRDHPNRGEGRRQDKVSTAGNRETFARAREVLQRGGAIAIFPEGTTHSDPRLRELKTGAARIALGASIRVSIVPTGLYYTAKQTFRSSALAYFGSPILVAPAPVDAHGGHPRV